MQLAAMLFITHHECYFCVVCLVWFISASWEFHLLGSCQHANYMKGVGKYWKPGLDTYLACVADMYLVYVAYGIPQCLPRRFT